MKFNKICIISLILIGFSSPAFAHESLSSKIKLHNPKDISSKANKGYTGDSEDCEDPETFEDTVIKDSLNGFSQMMQGATGNFNNFYSADEQRKQQADYAKQQIQK